MTEKVIYISPELRKKGLVEKILNPFNISVAVPKKENDQPKVEVKLPEKPKLEAPIVIMPEPKLSESQPKALTRLEEEQVLGLVRWVFDSKFNPNHVGETFLNADDEALKAIGEGFNIDNPMVVKVAGKRLITL